MVSAPGKLLLFGEYTILLGGNALAVPLPMYEGSWTFETPKGDLRKAQGRLLELAQFAEFHNYSWLDTQRLKSDLSQGLWIDSNIPSGYGIGSSGMVTALVYQDYAHELEMQLIDVKTKLAEIESFFHGSSSGIDPLTSYYRKPIVIGQNGGFMELLDKLPKRTMHVYLLDSNRKRNTAQLVDYFKFMRNSDQDFAMEAKELLGLTNNLLSSYISTEVPAFKDQLRALSFAQYNLFDNKFIPPDIREIWQNGLHFDHYTMKLCGAGGGGFFLVWSEKELGHTLGEFSLVKV